eukprot:TRINITY_DN2633_c0_g1_i1.p1 TRINITY_DN2633_c0_g1~~TRINITY_DN2633_c0_g1_i1.p1  ORF type:complete len:103 (-),score=6.90 TRINITY_DN2633_c0_g1_i1:67-375(-)
MKKKDKQNVKPTTTLPEFGRIVTGMQYSSQILQFGRNKKEKINNNKKGRGGDIEGKQDEPIKFVPSNFPRVCERKRRKKKKEEKNAGLGFVGNRHRILRSSL